MTPSDEEDDGIPRFPPRDRLKTPPKTVPLIIATHPQPPRTGHRSAPQGEPGDGGSDTSGDESRSSGDSDPPPLLDKPPPLPSSSRSSDGHHSDNSDASTDGSSRRTRRSKHRKRSKHRRSKRRSRSRTPAPVEEPHWIADALKEWGAVNRDTAFQTAFMSVRQATVVAPLKGTTVNVKL